MRLLANWREVLSHAWSIRFNVLAVALSCLEVGIPLMDGYVDVPRGLFAASAALAAGLAFWARLIAQRNLPGKDC